MKFAASASFFSLFIAAKSPVHASSIDGNYADEQAQRRLSYERVYIFHAGPTSWFNAREDCSDIGGDLATARSEAENDKIFEVRGESDAWIGLSDIPTWTNTAGAFAWQEDKSPVTYANWATENPNQSTDHNNCVLILEDKTWKDVDCGNGVDDDQGYPFICQVDLTYAPTYTPMPSREPTPVPSQSPVPEPTSKPIPAPTKSPVPEPTRKPIPAPTKSPVPEPTSKPIPAPTKSPVPAPTKQPTPNTGSCFHGNGTVLLQSGMSKRFLELSLGDVIKTGDAEGRFSFSPIVRLPHANNDEPAAFITLQTDTGKKVDMTSDHFIPRCDLKVVTAGELAVGDCLLTADGKETLVEISSTEKSGVYTAVTEEKFIVIDGIVASPFSKDSHHEEPKLDYEKYRLELERTRQRKLAYFPRKA